MQQYLQQGQAAINPGQAAVASSSPLAGAGTANLAKALAAMPASPSTQTMPAEVAQNAMGAGAQSQPNSPNGENMGGVGPTQNNLALANGIMQQQQPPQMPMPGQNGLPAMQNYQNTLSGGGWFGGGS